MSPRLTCGIDIGSTNIKVLLIDDEARTRWSRSIPVPRVEQDGRPSTDAARLVRTIEQLIIEGWRATGSTEPIAAISSTGVGEDGLTVDADLQPLDLALPWFDRRADPNARLLRQQFNQQIRAGVPLDGTRTAAKWHWLRQHRPAVMVGASSWIALTDYPLAWWSRTPFMSMTLAARTACYDVFERCWLPSHLDQAGAPVLPPVVQAGTFVGHVVRGALLDSGAASTGTRIVSGGHDHPIAASVVRRIAPDAWVDSLGTANLIYGETGTIEPRTDPYVAFSVPALGHPGIACLGVFEFSAALEPLRARDQGAALRAFLATDVAPGEPGPVAAILASLAHSPGRVPAGDGHPASLDVRCVLEANCFYARRMLASARSFGPAGQPVYAVGGWARSKALLQLRASVLGEPLHTIDEDELTALGAALIALTAREAGSQGQSRTVRRATGTVLPRADWAARYDADYPRVQAFLEARERTL